MGDKKYMIIDGIRVEFTDERNVLEVIRKVGIKMPSFCYHSDLSIYGACRMCMFENEKGGLEAACSTPPRTGMNIKTNTERLRRYRKNILELILANHCRDCTTCDFSNNCKLQALAQRFNIEGVRFPNHAKSTRDDDKSSLSIVRDAGKCILCGDCVRMCNDVQNVGAIDFAFRGSKMVISTAFGKPLADTDCVGCGQCSSLCPTGAIVVKDDIAPVWDAISNPEIHTTVQVAPAVRVAIGKELGVSNATDVMGKIVAALRRIGFDEVFDTSLGADLTIVEETKEFIERETAGEKLPLMTSCCPGWIRYVENRHPELLENNISTCKSPMEMLAAVLKDQARKKGQKMFHVAVMPCTAKKFEAARPEFTHDGERDVDAVITTQELIRMIKEAGLMFDTLEPEAIDMPYGMHSGAGVIFGVTGGVTEAVLRRVAESKTRNELIAISELGERGMKGIKEFEVPFGDRNLKIAVVSSLGNAERIIKRIKEGEQFDLVEVMACPGGCIAGGGQPYVQRDDRAARGKALYGADKIHSIRYAEENPIVTTLYGDVLKGREHELLHVEYKTK